VSVFDEIVAVLDEEPVELLVVAAGCVWAAA
jgi:hypothetical protein